MLHVCSVETCRAYSVSFSEHHVCVRTLYKLSFSILEDKFSMIVCYEVD